MQSAQKLKKDLEFNTELKQLMEVLKGIAASQFHQVEQRKQRFVKYVEMFEGFFGMIDFTAIDHPFAKNQGKLGLIMITSDEGFMGGVNVKVINAALAYPGASDASLITIGDRGAGYLKGLGYTCVEFPGIPHEGGYELAVKIRDFIIQEVIKGVFAKVVLFYPKPLSFTSRKIEALIILPCGEMFENKKCVVPKENLLVESSLSKMIEYLQAAWVMEKLLEVFEDSKLSEFSARTVHLEESFQVLQQKENVIRFQYFRSHHELVDRGMRETFSTEIIRKRKNKNS